MDVVEVLTGLGGVATRSDLIGHTSRREVDRAVRDGTVVVLARGRYALAVVDDALAAAHRLTGVVSHRSATLHWGWGLKWTPDHPDVTLRRNRRVDEAGVRGVAVHRADLEPDDLAGLVTSRDRTLVDCLRSLPADEALAVADSALREGYPQWRLDALARDARGPGSRSIKRAARLASPLAANPFESVLRHIATRVAGLEVRPQVTIRSPRLLGRPDLVDEQLMIILEADSFAWHGDRGALAEDARRYNEFVVAGWLVLRFSWEEVMFHPTRVRAVLEALVAERTQGAWARLTSA